MYVEHRIPRELRAMIDALWTVRIRDAVPDHSVLPDGCVDILFSSGMGLQVVGTMTKPQRFCLAAGTQIMGIRFRPGIAAALFRLPLEEITDHSIPLADILPISSRSLIEQAAETKSMQEWFDLISTSLRFQEIERSPFQKAIDTMVQTEGQYPLDALASHANLSLRQFRRQCRAYTGLSPKLLSRILRFRSSLSRLDTIPQESGADFAARCGYYDQAHFIDDFREFSGTTPGTFLKLRQKP